MCERFLDLRWGMLVCVAEVNGLRNQHDPRLLNGAPSARLLNQGLLQTIAAKYDRL